MNEETRKYYETTKFNLEESEPAEVSLPIAWTKIFYKRYPRLPSVELGDTSLSGELAELLERRKSRREFAESEVKLTALSLLLHHSAGLKENEDVKVASRRYPSAGARYPIETYVIAKGVGGLEEGTYHYNVKEHELELLIKGRMDSWMTQILGPGLDVAPVFIGMTGVLSRGEVKYGSNAYRFALIEAGHVGQSIHLLCEKLGLSCCAIGGFDNDKLVKLLDITEEEIPLYGFAVGNKNA